MIGDANYIYNVCSRESVDEDWVCWPYTSLERAIATFNSKIAFEFEFVYMVKFEDQEMIAYHSKEAFDHFKNTIEVELKE